VHVQVSTGLTREAGGLPLVFTRADADPWVPRNGEVVVA
jgi:hypothetical protein